jgi:hypothetical protein
MAPTLEVMGQEIRNRRLVDEVETWKIGGRRFRLEITFVTGRTT